MQVANYYQPN